VIRVAFSPDAVVAIHQKLLGDARITLGAENTACYHSEKLDAILSQDEYQPLFAAAAEQSAALTAAIQEAYKRIDRRPVLTLVAGGARRAAGFGADEDKAALRFAWSPQAGKVTHTGNLEWRRVENLTGSSDARTWKLGYEYSRLVLAGTSFSKDGATLSMAGAYEMYDHVPDAKYDTVAKLNAKLDFPISEGVSVPLSVTWANHESLITGEKELRAHFGFSIDLSKLKEAAKEKASGSGG
jgi:hypothetical protein